MRRYSCVFMLTACLGGCTSQPRTGNGGSADGSPFSIQVVPAEMTDTIPDQRCVLLVTLEDQEGQGDADGAVHVSASALGATVEVEPETLQPGQVAEITVIPEGHAADEVPQEEDEQPDAEEGEEPWTVPVTIVCERGGVERTAAVPLTVVSQEEDLIGPSAAEVRDLFIPWLAENRPELGITEDTEWTGTIVTLHILIVTHYLFFSEEWEMHVFWHVMVPPYDWARIELRRRFEETAPSLAFEIPSQSAPPPLDVQPIEPSETVWR